MTVKAKERTMDVATPAVLIAATLRAGALKDAYAPVCGPDLRLVEDAGVLAGPAENGPVLAVVSAPVHYVAARLGEGMAPAAALGEWADAATAVLALTRSRKRKVVLLDDRALVAPDAGLRAEVARRLGMSIDLPELVATAQPTGPLGAVAYALLNSDPDLAASLAAWTGEVLGAEGIGFGPDDALSAARVWQLQQSGEEPAVLRAREAVRLIQEINAQQLGQLETATQEIAELEVLRAQENATELAVLRASVEALELRLAEAEARRLRQEAGLGTQILADGAALAQLSAEKEAILASTSWKLTRPIRVTRRLLKR